MGCSEEIAMVGELCENLSQLTALYRQILKIVNREHDYLKFRNLDKLEGVMQDKKSCSDEIVARTVEIQRIAMAIFPKETVSVSRLVTYFNELRPNFENLAEEKIWLHVQKKLRECHKGFDRTYCEVKPAVEKNAYIIGRFLDKQRDYLQLWRETIASSEEGYSQAGARKTRIESSVIEVKA